ncbi:MAG: S41 family peptidase [Ignavibacteriae bacterium]|nr:MAG: S41 family peptidase [Ignavibacteriota bacterium]
MNKRKYLVPIFLMLISIGVLIGMKVNTATSGDNIFENVKKFNEALTLVQKNYVEDVNTDKLTEAAIRGMLGELDPHSVYITADQLKKVNEDFQGSFEGIGVEFDIINDTITIVTPISGGPSEALGIQAGDKIVKIDDVSAIKMTREDVPKKLRGTKGTKVHVSIVRAGTPGLLEFDIIRDKIPLYSVDPFFMVNENVGYIRVTRFSATTYDEFSKALETMKGQGMTKLVLDLRNNPGGYLDQAFKMASMFIDRGKKIVYTKSRIPAYNEEYLSEGGEYTKMPLIVLVNDGSASASEIVSGAIQDWDRGLIIGENTFGKGLVQRQYDLSDGSAMRVTTSRYYTPTGRLIQKPYIGGKYETMLNAELNGEDPVHKDKTDTTRPVFKTPDGRTVLGGGGVTPDYIVRLDTLTEYSVQLRRLNLFLEYTNTYYDANKDRLKSQYSGYVQFRDDFRVSEDMLRDFQSLATTKGITFNDEQWNRDLEFITTSIKSILARDIWGNAGSMAVFLATDTQFNRAMELFPEAEKLAHLK